jgi:hypothetical protein
LAITHEDYDKYVSTFFQVSMDDNNDEISEDNNKPNDVDPLQTSNIRLLACPSEENLEEATVESQS